VNPATTTRLLAPPPPQRRLWPHVVGIATGIGLLVLGRGSTDRGEVVVPVATSAAAAAAPVVVRQVAYQAEPDIEAAWGEALMQDTWFHPLAGPKRWMPRNHSQAFGAERPGDRPAECFSGHCGVDLGGAWGEPVRAVHDGVVERVNRGPNEDRGGIYVTLAHRDRTVFTQYFHLAAVPRWIDEGKAVAAGQVIGLLGDTGVKHSAPHLHFAVSVRPSASSSERYLDPEPLIAIWPLWLPDEDGSGRARATLEPPGLPARGRTPKRAARKSRVDDQAAAIAAPAEPAASDPVMRDPASP
jgi:murein DD-endopeptidase MepM/ murein hydrolase activator NlpD